ncbi:MAG: hypothetical protein HY014_16015 [Acidobacteria bacterium]|nr:hypothetical protein [Acidobacteriota bacterium]MBI3489654.1 hypothetical protein [Acidobacteriota bacterium]
MQIQDYHNSIFKKFKNLLRQSIYPFIGSILILVIILWWKYFLNLQNDYFIYQYKAIFRIPLFSGFLTIGSFMLSFKAFTVLRLHEDVYKSPEYQERWVKRAMDFSLKPITYLDPLARLTDTFFLAIFFSLMAAFLQVTLGLIPKLWLVCFCVWAALFSGCLVLRSLYVLRQNLVEWQKLLSKKYADELEAKISQLKEEIAKKESECLKAANRD